MALATALGIGGIGMCAALAYLLDEIAALCLHPREATQADELGNQASSHMVDKLIDKRPNFLCAE